MRYTLRVIESFRHAGLEKFFASRSKLGIQPKHAARLSLQLFALSRAKSPADLAVPGWGLHGLRGRSKGRWAMVVSGNWRLTFAFHAENVVLVDYEDYH